MDGMSLFKSGGEQEMPTIQKGNSEDIPEKDFSKEQS